MLLGSAYEWFCLDLGLLVDLLLFLNDVSLVACVGRVLVVCEHLTTLAAHLEGAYLGGDCAGLYLFDVGLAAEFVGRALLI